MCIAPSSSFFFFYLGFNANLTSPSSQCTHTFFFLFLTSSQFQAVLSFICFIIVSCVQDMLFWANHIIVLSFCFLLWKVEVILLILMGSIRRHLFFRSHSYLGPQRNETQSFLLSLTFCLDPKCSGRVFSLALHLLSVITKGGSVSIAEKFSCIGSCFTLG